MGVRLLAGRQDTSEGRVQRRDGGSGLRRVGLVAVAVMLAAGGLAAAPASPSDAVVLTVVATNDVHNQLRPPEDGSIGDLAGLAAPGDDPVGGLAYFAAHLDEVRSRAPEALYVDAGDMTGVGRGVARMFGDEPTIEAMNLLGLDVMAAGNHEFDAGLDHLRRLYAGGCHAHDCAYRHDAPYEGAAFATLSANVVEAATGRPVLPAWTLREVSGVRVGIVGLTTMLDEGRLDAFEEDEEVRSRAIREAVDPAVEEVVAAGAQVVVLVWHAGSRQQTLTWRADPNGCENMRGSTWNLREHLPDAVDLVVDGHTHQAYVCDEPGGPLMTQALALGAMYTEATITYDPNRDEVIRREAVNRWVTHETGPDPRVQGLIERYEALGGVDAPGWADLDGDTLGDGFEAFVSGSDPRTADTDADRLSDGHEVMVHRTDPRHTDSDRGGVDDGDEVDAGTNPNLFADDPVSGLLEEIPQRHRE